jgi:CO/xanthine dehydrogenase FAD-binding subunit/aerobic-type carbon monoxide dehydrogenase small subunit (CoxS/CutS family)
MKPASFSYVRPAGVAEAVDALALAGPGGRALAGGQSLVPMMHMRLMRPDVVIDLNRIPELTGIEVTAFGTRIGAMTRYAEIESSVLISERLPLLQEAVRHVGDRQVRNRGTIGGSLVHGDPTAEVPLVCLALGAQLKLRTQEGVREVPVDDFLDGAYVTALAPGELLCEVNIPSAPPACAFSEFGRKHNDFAIASVVVLGTPRADGTWESLCIAAGGVDERPALLPAAADRLQGSRMRKSARRPSPWRSRSTRQTTSARPPSTGWSSSRISSPVPCAGCASSARASMSDHLEVTVNVNGEQYRRTAAPRMHLADFLRHELSLTGTHVGCEQGVCGNCTVLVDGVAVKSCLMLAVQADGAEVTTVESLSDGEELHALQQAFKHNHALQCGYCTPGFMMTAIALRSGGTRLSRKELRNELAGVLCRCTGYQNIITAVEQYLGAGTEAEHGL